MKYVCLMCDKQFDAPLDYSCPNCGDENYVETVILEAQKERQTFCNQTKRIWNLLTVEQRECYTSNGTIGFIKECATLLKYDIKQLSMTTLDTLALSLIY